MAAKKKYPWEHKEFIVRIKKTDKPIRDRFKLSAVRRAIIASAYNKGVKVTTKGTVDENTGDLLLCITQIDLTQHTHP